MERITGRLLIFLAGERGASIVEYALLVILIAIVALIAVIYTGDEVSETYSIIADSVVNAGSN